MSNLGSILLTAALSQAPTGAGVKAEMHVGGVTDAGQVMLCIEKGHLENMAKLTRSKPYWTGSCNDGSAAWVPVEWSNPPGTQYLGYRVLGQYNGRKGRGGTSFVVYWK